PLFRATSAAYLEDPEKVLRDAPKDELLGFGIEAAVLFLTPVALEIAKTVVTYLVGQIRSAFEKESSEAIATRVHSLFHPSETEGAAAAEPPPHLTQEQLDRVHALALEKARALELPQAQADLLADAMVGSLVVP